MEGSKNPLSSVAIWGGIIAVASQLLPVLAPFAGLAPADGSEVVTHVRTIGGAVGGLMAIYGRWVATKKIG